MMLKIVIEKLGLSVVNLAKYENLHRHDKSILIRSGGNSWKNKKH